MQKETLEEKLEKALEKAKHRLEKVSRQIGAKTVVIMEVRGERNELENEQSSVRQEIREISDLLLLEKGLSANLIKLRKSILSKIKQSTSDQITIARKNALEEEIEKLKSELQNACQHSLVLSYDGYEGSSSYDYKNKLFGHRRCAVCGLYEESGSSREDIYKILIEQEKRLVKRDLRHYSMRKENIKYDIWQQDLAYFMELFKEGAGSINVGTHTKKSAS